MKPRSGPRGLVNLTGDHHWFKNTNYTNWTWTCS